MAEPGHDGPFLKAAFFCESVIEEKSGVLTAIRIIERMTVEIVIDGPEPRELPPTRVALTAVILIVNGSKRGPVTVRLTARAPSGRTLGTQAIPVQLTGDDDHGARIVVPLQFVATEDGRYWFDVSVGEALATRMPLPFARVLRRVQGQAAAPAPGGAAPAAPAPGGAAPAAPAPGGAAPAAPAPGGAAPAAPAPAQGS